MPFAIENNTAASRFEYKENGQLCYLNYSLNHHVMSITHTWVPQALEGRGIAAELTKAALTAARENHWKILPICSYTVAYIKRHPEYQDLLAR